MGPVPKMSHYVNVNILKSPINPWSHVRQLRAIHLVRHTRPCTALFGGFQSASKSPCNGPALELHLPTMEHVRHWPTWCLCCGSSLGCLLASPPTYPNTTSLGTHFLGHPLPWAPASMGTSFPEAPTPWAPTSPGTTSLVPCLQSITRLGLHLALPFPRFFPLPFYLFNSHLCLM